LASSVLIELYF